MQTPGVLSFGRSYFAKGDFEKAIAAYDEAVRLPPNLGAVYHNLGNTYQHIGELEDARKSFSKALQISTNPVVRASASNALFGLDSR